MLFSNKKDATFYDLLNEQAQAATDAAATFYTFTTDFTHITEGLKRLEKIEHDADALSHAYINTVNTQFITPLDKEDMHELSERLDDITDMIESAASRIAIFRLKTPRPELQSLVALMVGITKETQAMVLLLRKGFKQAELPAIIAGIHAMESQSDKAFRHALTNLFEEDDLDLRLLLKWKEVYERIEKAINRCEKLAGFIESLVIKYT